MDSQYVSNVNKKTGIITYIPSGKTKYGKILTYDSLDRTIPIGITIKRSHKRIIKPALVFCGTPVAIQWKMTIERFTNMKYLLITDINGVRELNKIMKNDQIDNYDIIIIKNGFISGKFDFDGYCERRCKYGKGNTRYIINIVANLSRNYDYTWSRLIIDDFDIIDLPYNCALMPAVFTWIISSTDKSDFNHYETYGYNYGSDISHILKYKDYNFGLKSMSNVFLRSIFNISCSKEFTEECVQVGIPKFWLYKFYTNNDVYINMIREFDNNNIVEMLNGDAVETAAAEIGIKTTSVVDMFEKILDSNYAKYKHAIDMELFMKKYANYNTYPKPHSENYTEIDFIKQKDIKYNYMILNQLYDTYSKQCQESKEKVGIALERVKSNIKEGFCQICCSELEYENTIITKCCGIIQCEICGIQCSNFNKIGNVIEGKCSNCRKKLLITDIIFLNKDFDMNKILADDVEYEIKEECKDEGKKTIEAPKNKLDVILDIVQGNINYNRKQVNANIPNLLMGCHDLPDSEPHQKSVIIFAGYDETIKNIQKN